MRDGLFASFFTAMLVVTLAPRHHAALAMAPSGDGLRLQVAWLAQRESALGDWEAVKPPLRAGDELQLTVVASEDACVYVLDGERRQIFPPRGAPARIQGNWPYAIPGEHRTFKLDGAVHDKLVLVAARHPLEDPTQAIGHARSMAAPDLQLPLRDGRRGGATTRVVQSDDILVDVFEAR